MDFRTKVRLSLGVPALLACLLASPMDAIGQAVAVTDIALETQFQDTWVGQHRRGRAGIAGDFNLDGRPDYFIGNPGDQSFFVINTLDPNGQTVFMPGPALANGDLAWGGAAGDYDNDGDYDLFISVGGNEGVGLDYLYKNLWLENGQTTVTFQDVSVAAGIQGPVDPNTGMPVATASANAIWTDFDNDSDSDLFVNGNIQVASPPEFLGRNTLWMNNGNGTFTDVTGFAGLAGSLRRTRHSTFFDMDNDGDKDFYEMNHTEPNILWRNRLAETGIANFEDVTALFSPGAEDLAFPLSSFSSTASDLNNDGWLDLFVVMRGAGPEPGSPYPEGHALFINNGGTGFTNIAASTNMNATFQGVRGVMGNQVGDVNGDGTPDIYIGTGGPPAGQFDQLYLSDNAVTAAPHYQDSSNLIDFPAPEEPGFPVAYPPYPYRTHGTSFVDVTQDGNLEIAVVTGGPAVMPDTVREPNRLFKLALSPQPGFFKVRPRGDGVSVGRDAVDTRLALTVRKGAGAPWTLHRVLLGGSAFSAQKGFEIHFYTGDADVVESLEITWPDGAREMLSQGLSIGDSMTVERGAGAGSIPPTLTVAEDPGGLALAWGGSCSAGATDYAIYQGNLGDFASHAPVMCTTGGATSAVIPMAAGDHYFLVVPRNGTKEGSYGRDGASLERIPSGAACAAQQVGTCN